MTGIRTQAVTEILQVSTLPPNYSTHYNNVEFQNWWVDAH